MAEVVFGDLSKLDFVVMSHRHGGHMGRISLFVESESRREDLRTQGSVRSVRRRLAKYLLSEGSFTFVGTAVL